MKDISLEILLRYLDLWDNFLYKHFVVDEGAVLFLNLSQYDSGIGANL